LKPRFLDEVSVWAREIEQLRDELAPGRPLWLGETGNAQCGGQPGVSETFAGGFWWLDQLGLLARRGHEVVVRQTLSGSNYGLLDDLTLDPRPDYFTSVLWRRLVGERVMAAHVHGDNKLRVYAHCTRGEPGSMTLAYLNLDEERGARIDLGRGAEVDVYQLDAESLTAPTVRLNGQPLVAGPDGSLPSLLPVTVAGPVVDVAPRSYGFLVVRKAGLAACM
jgi:hypothetical protein